MNFFKAEKNVTDWTVAPFESYLLVTTDNNSSVTAYELDDNAPLDLQILLDSIFSDHGAFLVDIYPQNGGENYAAIYTDGREPQSPIVWNSCDFYLTSMEE